MYSFMSGLYLCHVCDSSIFIFIPLYEYPPFIHSTVGGHVGCLQFGTVINSAVLNILVCRAVHIYIFLLLSQLICALLKHKFHNGSFKHIQKWMEWNKHPCTITSFSNYQHFASPASDIPTPRIFFYFLMWSKLKSQLS